MSYINLLDEASDGTEVNVGMGKISIATPCGLIDSCLYTALRIETTRKTPHSSRSY